MVLGLDVDEGNEHSPTSKVAFALEAMQCVSGFNASDFSPEGIEDRDRSRVISGDNMSNSFLFFREIRLALVEGDIDQIQGVVWALMRHKEVALCIGFRFCTM